VKIISLVQEVNHYFYFMKKLIILTIGITVLSTACKKTPSTELTDRLQTYMTGSFTSGQQAVADSNYFDISLHMVPIWEDKEGHWLYVEQAVTAMPNTPYRQRVYKLEENPDSTITSHIYELKYPDLFVGAHTNPSTFKDYDKTVLSQKEGCGVTLSYNYVDGYYSGSTAGNNCASTLEGASYATSKVAIYPNRLESWDQGFNNSNEQVWGAENGPYIFNKQ